MTTDDQTGDRANVFDLIEKICAEFRVHWKQDDRPPIESLLGRVPADAQPTLFRNLLQAEIRYRSHKLERPTAAEYLERFPAFSSIVRQSFGEASIQSLRSDSPPADTVMHSAAAPDRLGDYRLIRELGSGAFGTVYEARHVQRQNVVALKRLNTAITRRDPAYVAEHLHRLCEEFRVLSEINHCNLVGMQTLEVDQGTWFFTMDFVQGTDFLTYVRPAGEFDEQRLRDTLRQLVAGIAALHAENVVHRDLKPSNVMVDDEGRVVILDFGLVAKLASPADETIALAFPRFSGTPAYAAPEQCMGEWSEASDWYAMGTMIYEAMTGERPFSGDRVLELKRIQSAPTLAEQPHIAADLAQLTDALLCPVSRERPNLPTIAAALSIDLDSGSRNSGSHGSHSPSGMLGVENSPLIGRAPQQACLEEIHREWQAREGAECAFVIGQSGEGKTTLIERFLTPWREDADTLVLSGRCHERESVPYKAIDGLINALVGHLRSQPADFATSVKPPHVEVLAQLFPAIRRVDAYQSLPAAPRLSPQETQHKAFQALKRMLQLLGQQVNLVLFIDDLQWGDTGSADALVHVMSPPDAPRMIVLSSIRMEDVERAVFMQRWNVLLDELPSPARSGVGSSPFPCHRITIGAWSLEECQQYLVSRFDGGLDRAEEHARRIFAATDGNPYFVAQCVEDHEALVAGSTSAELREVVESRLRRLPEDAVPLLELIAVSGRAVAASEVCEAAKATEKGFAILNRMRNERLVRSTGSGQANEFDTYHDKIRESVLAGLPEDRRREWHLRLGETIERREGPSVQASLESLLQPDSQRQLGEDDVPLRIFDLVYHFAAAGHPQKSVAYGVLAAERAKQQFALDVALGNFRLARRKLSTESEHLRYRVLAGLGETLQLSGQYEEAYQVLSEASAAARSDEDRIAAQSQQADIVYKTKSLQESITAYEDLLRQLDVRIPASISARLAESTETEVIARAEALANTWNDQPTEDSHWQSTQTIRILCQLCFPAMFHDPSRATWASTLAVALTHHQSNALSACTARAMHGLTVGCLSHDIRTALEHVDAALQIALQLGVPKLEALARYCRTATLALSGEFADALVNGRQCARLYAEMGDTWRLTYSTFFLSLVHSRSGDIQEAVRTSHQAFEWATRFGQRRLAQSQLEPWAVATSGNLPFDTLCKRFQAVPDDLSSTITRLIAESIWHRYHERTGESLRSAEQAYAMLEGFGGLTRLYIAIPNLAHALRVRALAVAPSDVPQSRQLLERARQMAVLGVEVESKARLDLPYALRELGLVHKALDDLDTAHAYLRQSCFVASEQGARHQYSLSLLACGQVGEALGRTESLDQIVEAEQALSEFAAQVQAINEELGLANSDSQSRQSTNTGGRG